MTTALPSMVAVVDVGCHGDDGSDVISDDDDDDEDEYRERRLWC